MARGTVRTGGAARELAMNGVFATLGILSPVLLVGTLYLFWPLLPILLAAGLVWWATTWPPEIWKGAVAVAAFGVAAFIALGFGPVLLLDLCLVGGAVLLRRAGREWKQVHIALRHLSDECAIGGGGRRLAGSRRCDAGEADLVLSGDALGT